MNRSDRFHLLPPFPLSGLSKDLFNWLDEVRLVEKWYKLSVEEDIRLRFGIDDTVVCSIEIIVVIAILLHHTKLVTHIPSLGFI